jgi:DNA-binding transcriptional ArsR family regulator
MPRPGSFPFEFAVTPRFDVFYALYSLTSSAPSQIDSWKERTLGLLPGDFDGAAKQVAPLPIFWPLLADAIQTVPGEVTFEEVLSSLREMPTEKLQQNVLSGIFHDRDVVSSLVARKRSLRDAASDDKLKGAELLGHFGLRPYSPSSRGTRTIDNLLSNPKGFRDDLVRVLQKFWHSGFRQDWSGLEPGLRAESFRMRDLREERSAESLGRELNLPITFDDEAREIRPRTGSPIGYDRVDRCYVIPSAFNGRRWWAKYETGAQRVTLYLPITTDPEAPNRVFEEQKSSRDPRPKKGRAINAESVFRALGDTTRYAIASILARTPTTSAELSRSLKVSKPTITHHVHALRSAGLITETPSGGSTKLTLSRETVAALSDVAVEQLFSSTGDLALDTTRKRRPS